MSARLSVTCEVNVRMSLTVNSALRVAVVSLNRADKSMGCSANMGTSMIPVALISVQLSISISEVHLNTKSVL